MSSDDQATLQPVVSAARFLALPERGETIAVQQANQLELIARPAPGTQLIAQLKEVLFGSSGLRYRRVNVAEQLELLPNAVFLELRRAGELIGTYAVAVHPWGTSEQAGLGVYRALLTLREDARGQGLGRWLVQSTLVWLGQKAQQAEVPTLSWGCIEAGNQRSRALLHSLGASTLGRLESLMVFRQWPKERLALEVMSQAALREVLNVPGPGATACPAAGAGNPADPCFVLRDESGVLAAAQATVIQLDLRNPAARREQWLYRGLRLIPPARRRFDPHCFSYLKLSNVVIRPGQERLWADFLSTLLAKHGVYLGMFCLDPGGETRRLLGGSGVFGRLTSATRQEMVVLGQAWNWAPERLAAVRDAPFAFGPLDI